MGGKTLLANIAACAGTRLGIGAGVACDKQCRPGFPGSERAESGSEAVEVTLVLPVLTLLVAGALDLGLVGLVANQAEAVAAESARYVALHPDVTDSSALKARIGGLYPNLIPSAEMAEAGYGLDVTLEYGSEESSVYQHHLALSNGTYDTRSSITTTQPVSVTVTISRPYFTPLGAAWSQAAGGNGVVSSTAAAVSRIDKTSGESW